MHVTDYVNGEFLGANCIPLPQLYLRELTRPSSAEGLARETNESTVGVALGSHIAERKRVRAHGGGLLLYFGRNFGGPLLRPDTDSSSVNIPI